jgi:D-3-phosphoglycerate dehydrogenase
MCSLARSIPQATASMKKGLWEKSKFMGAELSGKTLGVIGAGNIGKIVVSRAQGLKMKVIAFDPFLTAELAEKLDVERVSLNELFARSDFITIHTPLNDKTRYLINKDAFAKMKKGVFIINAARGGIVHELDLVSAIEQGIVAGAALDVFEQEPPPADHPLLKQDKVISTPHLGAATAEAQENVAVEVAEQFADFFQHDVIRNAVNFPSLSGKMREVLAPFQILAEKLGGLHGQLAEEAPTELAIEYRGDITEYSLATLTSRIVYGLLRPISEPDSVNPVNAISVAKDRGIQVIESKVREAGDYANLIRVSVTFSKGKRLRVAGTVFGKSAIKLVSFDEVFLEAPLDGTIVVIHNEDRPGVIGKVGTFLGEHQVNISWMQLGCKKNGQAISFYGVDTDVAANVVTALAKTPGRLSVQTVVL